MKNKKIMTSQEYTEHSAKEITVHLLELLNNYENVMGAGTGIRFVETFLKMFIAQVVYGEIAHPAINKADLEDMDEEELSDLTIESLRGTKDAIQDAVSGGFAAAMTQFSGKQMDYYCQVRPVPPMSTKIPS